MTINHDQNRYIINLCDVLTDFIEYLSKKEALTEEEQELLKKANSALNN